MAIFYKQRIVPSRKKFREKMLHFYCDDAILNVTPKLIAKPNGMGVKTVKSVSATELLPSVSGSVGDIPVVKALPESLSVKELAGFLRISTTSAYETVASGRLPHIRTGKGSRSIRILKRDLESWLESERRKN